MRIFFRILALTICAVAVTSCDNPVVTPPQATRTGTNIQDIAFFGTKAFITQYQSPNILVVDKATGTVTDSIDLSRYNTYAGTSEEQSFPYMSPIAMYSTKGYVGCQRLAKNGDWLSPADTSCIAVFDAGTHQVRSEIKLRFKNPTSISVLPENNRMFVACTGAYGVTDGAVEVIDLTKDSLFSYWIPESNFGGDVDRILVLSLIKGYATVSGMDGNNFVTRLVEFNPSSRAVLDTLTEVDNPFGGFVHDQSYLYVADMSFSAPGVVVFDHSSNSKVAGPISTGLPPSSLALCATHLLVGTTSTDYSESNVSIIDLQDLSQAKKSLLATGLHTDHVVRSDGTDGYILQRGSKKDEPNTLVKVTIGDLQQNTVTYESTLAKW